MSAEPNASPYVKDVIGLVFASSVRIFPAHADDSKKPHIKGWKTAATDDFVIVQAWWAKWPNALVAMPTGEMNGLWGIDVDYRHKGHETLAGLVDRYGPLPRTAHYRTPGGERYLFKWPAGVTIKSRNGESGIGAGIDVRGGTAEGEFKGYVILPPSVRSDGRKYEWDDGSGLDSAVDAPLWLMFLAIFNPREREALAAIGITGADGFKGLPASAWQEEADKRLKAAKPAPEPKPVDRKLSTGEIEGLDRYVRDAIKSECANLGNTAVNRQDHIGTSILSCQSLIKGLDAFGIDTAAVTEFAIEGLSTAFDALPDGDHKKESIADRWERNWPQAKARDLTGKWARRTGSDPAEEFEPTGPGPSAPAGNLLEFGEDVNMTAIIDRASRALVKGILHPGDSGVLYGESRAGKSFLGLDMGWSIAQGRDWHGRKVNKAPVLYVALEGKDGFRKRMLVAIKAHGSAGVWFARLTAHPSLVKDDKMGKHGLAIIREGCRQLEAKTGQPVGLIVIDTYARATAGDSENDTDAVMNFVEHRAGKLARETGAAVLTIAHTNRLGDLRGSLHLRNAMDVVLKAERRNGGAEVERTLIGEKVKDGAEVVLFDFSLETVELAKDADGDAVDSCVVRSTPPKPPSPFYSP